MQQLPTVEEIVKNPDSFIEREKKNYMPGWKGILLAWIVKQLNPDDLSHITRIRTFGRDGHKYYKFDPKEFIYQSACKYDQIRELHQIGLDRFELDNGGFYQFVQTDGEYNQDSLAYHEPVLPEVIFEEGFSLLLLQNISENEKKRIRTSECGDESITTQIKKRKDV